MSGLITPIFLDGRDVVVFKDPITNNAHQYRWWADNGLLHCECQATGDYKTVLVRDALLRLKALNDMIGNSRKKCGGFRKSDIEAYQQYIDQMIALCQKAHRQGRPEMPEHVKQRNTEAKAAQQSRMIIIPGL